MKAILTMICLLCILNIAAAESTPFTWYHPTSDHPVLTTGVYGNWDSDKVWNPEVLYFDGKYHMYYAGSDRNEYAIGHASSSDGHTWTKDSRNPIISGGPASLYETMLFAPKVVKVNTNFYMYFTTWEGCIGLATSDDGIVWTSSTRAVLTPGAPDAWDGKHAVTADVIHDDSGFKMWYNGVDKNDNYKVGYATSNDGIKWTKHAGNPIFEPRETGAWDSGPLLYASSIVYDGSYYHMWYSGENGTVSSQIGHASSADGLTWLRLALDAPEIGRGQPGSWNDNACFLPTVLLKDGSYHIWYEGASKETGDSGFENIGYATTDSTLRDPVAIEIENPLNPGTPILMNNYPNPFNPETHIRYSLSEGSVVTLVISDALGHEVVQLVSAIQQSGDYDLIWSGKNNLGHDVPAGVYFARITAGRESQVIKMLLLK